MSDDKATMAGANGDRIDVGDTHALHDWAKRLDSTVEAIREAIDAVGERAADVELHLKGTRSTTNADQELRGEGQAASRPDAAPPTHR